MSSVILGPLGNYLMPLMIGSKRMAFPRIEALSFWLTPAAYLVLLSGLLFGGFPFGWTGYAPLSVQATQGADAYAVAFGIMGLVALGALIWLETLIMRARVIPQISFVEQPPTYAEAFAVQRFQSGLSAFTVLWNYLAVIAIVFWVLFYLTA